MRRSGGLPRFSNAPRAVQDVRREEREARFSVGQHEIQLAIRDADRGLCRAMTITDVARRMHLDWHAVKELDKIYMREQLARAGHPAPNVIGIDEVSIRKRHVYRIVVSDLERK